MFMQVSREGEKRSLVKTGLGDLFSEDFFKGSFSEDFFRGFFQRIFSGDLFG
jgi:hypothetical protein